MNKDQATPKPELYLPWKLDGVDVLSTAKLDLLNHIAIFGRPEYAAYAIKAVNAHDELVEALKHALLVFNNITPQSRRDWGKPKHVEMIEQALSKIEAN